ncbi:MAG: aldo/keto reductase [bacterium]|nr:aldo/keto reductase [bacterium]
MKLAWVLAYGDVVVPIPGMRREERILENLGAADVALSAEEYAALNAEFNKITVYGIRDNKDIAKLGTVPADTGK